MTTIRTIRFSAAIGLVAALSSPLAAEAQLAHLASGARLRLSAPAFDIVSRKGTLLNATADSLTIAFRGRGAPVTIPIDEVSRLDVSTGKNRGLGVLRGAGIGLVAGALLGVGLGAAVGAECGDYTCRSWAACSAVEPDSLSAA